MKINSLPTLGMLAGAVLFFSTSGNVFAADEKVYTGAGCHEYYGSQSGDVDHRGHRLENTVASARWVTCPIARDNTSNTDGLPYVYVRMNRSTSASAGYLCYLKNYTSYGVQTSWDSNTFSGTGDYSMYLTLASTNSYGHYVVYCNVPSGSYLYNYRVIEN